MASAEVDGRGGGLTGECPMGEIWGERVWEVIWEGKEGESRKWCRAENSRGGVTGKGGGSSGQRGDESRTMEREILSRRDGGEVESGTEEVSGNCRVGRGGGNRRRDGWRRREDLWRGWRG